MKNCRYSTTLIALCVALLGACTADDANIDDELDLGVSSQAAGTFPSVTSFSSRGPFATTVQTLGFSCTVHRPTILGQGGVTHPVVIWGNGTGASPSIYSGLLSHLASHGFIVVAANTTNSGSGSQMLTCLTNVITANSQRSSVFFQRVDITRVGASGHSQGGAGTIMAGRDARVDVTAPIQPYITPIFGGGTFSRSSIGEQQGPMLLLSGSRDTIAIPAVQQQPVFDGTNVPVFWATAIGATHFEAAGSAGVFRGPLTAWFRSALMDDAAAAAVFSTPCTLCTTAGWTIEQRN